MNNKESGKNLKANVFETLDEENAENIELLH